MQRARFVINEHLSAGLVRGSTVIYVDGKRFDQCKYLLLVRVDPCDLGSRAASEASDGDHVIDSIDEAAVSLDHSMEPLPENPDVEIDAKDEFWGHCSNLQAWAEHDYDTRLLHSNLSFPLLKALADAGDPVASGVFKAEVMSRLQAPFEPTRQYLVKEGYLEYLEACDLQRLARYLSRSGDLDSVVVPALCNMGHVAQFGSDDRQYIRGRHPHVTVSGKTIFAIDNDLNLDGLQIRDLDSVGWERCDPAAITALHLRENWLDSVPGSIRRFTRLDTLDIANNFLESFPEAVFGLESLVDLDVSYNYFRSLPEGISALSRLECLSMNQCALFSFPAGIGALGHLRFLYADFNRIEALPPSFGALASLQELHLKESPFEAFPAEICKLARLEVIDLSKNRISRMPRTLEGLASLRNLEIGVIGYTRLPGCLAGLVQRARVIVNGKSAKNGFVPVPLPPKRVLPELMCCD
jgi:hypothetical protein